MYRYASSSKQSAFRSTRPVTNDEIAYYAPSILANEPHESRGERYSFISTIDVLDGLRKEGFQPFEVRQTRVKDQSKREHTKHLIRLRHENAIALKDEVPEIILVNSHEGSSSFQLLAGFFRMVCSNGLIAGDVCDDIRIRHSGNILDNVIEGSYRVLDNLEIAADRIDAYKSTALSPQEQLALANAAIDLRWDRDELTGSAPVRAESLIMPRRWDDKKSDLFSTFNVIQENLVKGGVRSVSSNGRRTRTREVGGVNENVKLNRALWTLADRFHALKNGTLDSSELIVA